MSDATNPEHYQKHPSGVECIDITRWFNFNRGNAIKYIWRAGKKDDEIEDLKKAIWYLRDEIARIRMSEKVAGTGEGPVRVAVGGKVDIRA